MTETMTIHCIKEWTGLDKFCLQWSYMLSQKILYLLSKLVLYISYNLHFVFLRGEQAICPDVKVSDQLCINYCAFENISYLNFSCSPVYIFLILPTGLARSCREEWYSSCWGISCNNHGMQQIRFPQVGHFLIDFLSKWLFKFWRFLFMSLCYFSFIY